MYTVVVADDEEELRSMLVRRIDWEKIGFQVVGEAENGVQALELVEQLEPDLLLTDIKMPFISGIELARQVREIRPMVQIAFLSGFDDFSYAQQAIQYNIISYMLKPISAEELTEELYKIKKIIDKKFEDFLSNNSVKAKMEKTEFLLSLILDGYGYEINDLDLSKKRENELLKNAITCGVIKEDNAFNMKYVIMVSQFKDEEDRNVTERSNVNAVDKILEKYVNYSSFYLDERIISFISATKKGLDKYLHILTEELVQSAKRIMNLNCQVGISRASDVISGCHECYLEAINAISYKGKKEEHIHFISDKERIEEVNQEKVDLFIKEVENHIRGGNVEELKRYIENFFDSIVSGGMISETANYVTVQMISSVFKIVYAVAGNEAVSELQKYSPIQKVTIFENSKDAVDKYMDLCTNARKLVKEQIKKSSDILCQEAINIIDKDYSNPELSLVSVSSSIAVSPNYLSALLKRTTGKTFIEHLTEKRINIAQDMLLGTQMKIREITENCGYNDQHYFSYCFKKITGESPNSYRRRNEK